MGPSMAPLLSIVTVTKDDPEGWRSTVHSLEPLRTASFSWEHIAVNGSRPGTALSPTPWPLVELKESPVGIYAAMNTGITHASGDFIWFLNGGDRLRDPAALHSILQLGRQEPSVDLICAAADLTAAGQFSFVSFPRTTLQRSLLSGRSLCHQAMIFRRQIFQDLGPYSTDYRIAGDEEFLLRFFLSRRKSACVPDRLVYFDTNGLSSRGYRERYQELSRARRLMRGNVPPLDYARYALHQRVSGARAHLFARLRHLPFSGWLRFGWLGWRRWSLRYR